MTKADLIDTMTENFDYTRAECADLVESFHRDCYHNDYQQAIGKNQAPWPHLKPNWFPWDSPFKLC